MKKPAALSAALLVFTATLAAAYAAEIEPSVTLGLTHTDNVRNETVDGLSETIYRVEPSLVLTHETERITVDIDYLLQAFQYEKLSENEVFQQYDAVFRSDIVPESLYMEFGGSRSQTIVDPEQALPVNNLSFVNNRQDRDEYYVQPGFQFGLGGNATVQGVYRNSWIENNGNGLQDAKLQSGQLSIDNYRRGQGLTWALRYGWALVKNDESPPWENQQAVAELGFWISGNSRVFASGGKESDWDTPFDPTLEATIWEVGFSHQVGERIRAEFAAGERSFGASFRGSLQVTFRRGSTELTYNQQPMAQALSPFRTGGFRDPLRFDDFLNRPGSAELFINERLEWRTALNFQRTRIGFGIFDDRRTRRSTGDGSALLDQEQRGVNARVSYRLGSKTTLALGGSLRELDFGDGGTADFLNATFGVDYRLGEQTSIMIEYSYVDLDGQGESRQVRRDFISNTSSLLITRAF